MPAINVRRAVRSDMEALHGLFVGLVTFEKAEGQFSLTVKQLQGGFDDNLFTAFVAEEGDALLGYALCYPRYSTWRGPTLYLEDIYVEKQHRRCGVGFKLFDAVAKLAKEKNAMRLEWQVQKTNTGAIKFYTEKLRAEQSDERINCRLDETRVSGWPKVC
ncbi:N-acetyltransferase ats1 [Diplonema papillatum]|nr:N-acetyltransferase ats1 [Diplonema papillatum]